MTMEKRKEIRFCSDPESFRHVERFVEEISDFYHLNDSYFGNILIALTEAVSNAIQHGNKNNSSKKVHILFESKPEGLSFKVIDQGDGFNYKDYLSKDDLLLAKEMKGQGLVLIHSLADEVHFQNKGRVIEILFRIHGIDQEIHKQRAGLLRKFFHVTQKVKE